MRSPPIIAHPPTTPVRILEHLLTHPPLPITPTTLLIVQTRGAFITSLLTSITDPNSSRLLHHTLHDLSVAPHIQIVYTPTLTHLRAWLSVSGLGPTTGKGGKLVVYGLVRAHKGTSEWSVQGLSESMAALVECGHRMRRKVWVCESLLPEMAREGTLLDGLGSEANDGEDMEGLERRNVDEEGENFSESAYSQEEGRARPPPELDTALPGHAAEDEQDGRGQEETEEQRAKREKERNIYYARLPMLNGSSHREGLGDRGGWSGRTVEVGVVMKRWTTFTSIEL